MSAARLDRPPVDSGTGATLADVLERVLDKGMVVTGDISIRLVDVELLTIKVRLLLASVDRASEMGIDWWRHDPFLSGAPSPRNERRLLADPPQRLDQLIDSAQRFGHSDALKEGQHG